MLTVAKEEIRNITLSHDSRSRHPFLRFFAGFILVVTGIIFLIAAFLIAEGGVFLLQVQSTTYGIPVIPIVLWGIVGAGLWLILGVFPGRYNLFITTMRGTRKLFFEETADIGEIRDFLSRAVTEFGYEIDVALLGTMHIPEKNGAE